MPDRYPDLLPLLETGIIVTANERLSRQLRLRHAAECQAAGQQVWSRPAILSWSAWLRECHDALVEAALAGAAPPPPGLLSKQQAEAVWQGIIERSEAGSGLLQIGATAAAAAEAWELVCGWRIPLEAIEQEGEEDTRAFAGWAQAYRERSRREGWLEPARLADCIAGALGDGRLSPPAEVHFAGFDDWQPQQQALLGVLREQGSRVQDLTPGPPSTMTIEQQACSDAAAEIRAAACWARQQLEQNPELDIGIVIPDLATCRDTVVRVFDEVLCPAQRLPDADGSRPYNISLGAPLAGAAPVHDALLALGLAAGATDWTTVGALLRSPYLAGADTEWGVRARLDVRLRRQGRERIGLRDLQYYLQSADCPILRRAIDQCHTLQPQFGGQQSAAAHAGLASQWLTALGWSRGRHLSSAEYQTVNAWWELLGDYAALDAYADRCDWPQALGRLRRLAAGRTFQPQSPPAPVQILGLLEAAGMQFDRLWLMGLHDAVWPASPRPQPLLPTALQRRYQLPHASAARELEFAERTTRRLLTSAPRIVVSWPLREGDAALRPSPLLADLPTAEPVVPQADLMHWLHDRAPAPVFAIDEPPPALHGDRPTTGGTSVLRNQAACPFRAFAEHRLQARELEEPVPGLDAAGRGSVLHEVMRVLWQELGDQASLLQQDPAAQAELVARCVERALADWERKNARTLPVRFRQVEAERLQSLAGDWLALDRQRAPFTVESCEAPVALALEGLTINGRMDRLDRLADGKRLVIDYKTGRAEPRAWLDERPDEPQLPLYALSQRGQLAGIAFARLKVGELGYKGVADRGGLAPGIDAAEDWPYRPDYCESLDDLLAYWQRQLTALARSHCRGDSEVDPKDPRQTCRYCPQGTLCRIAELRLGAAGLEDGDD